MNIKKISLGVGFLVLSFFLIQYGMTRPCEIGPITQTQNGVDIEVKQPFEMDRMVCLSTDFMALFSILVGTAAIFPAMSGIFSGLTDDKRKKK
ncbi:MAG: hypothetical protein AABW46_01110 [Nanoarchaeota archaeon]